MSILDVEALLAPVSAETPCGDNLEYDAQYIALETASRGKSEQQYGEHVVPAEPPDWQEVVRIGLLVARRTMDLRVACLITQGLLSSEDSLEAFADGLCLVAGYLDRFWDQVHPQLDPDDGFDPTLRINTLSALRDPLTVVPRLRALPLAVSRDGKFSLADLDIARGEAQAEGAPKGAGVSLATIEAAFAQEGADALFDRLRWIDVVLSHVATIDALLTERVGSSQSVSFDELRQVLQRMRLALTHQAKRLGWNLPDSADSATAESESADAPSAAAAAPTTASESSGEIRTRQDVIRALDRICRYYESYEPSSPVPLLLQRAKRLASMSFLEIVKELTPDAFSQARAVGGNREADDDR